MGRETSVHFRCAQCDQDRDMKRELSHFSKDALANPAARKLKAKERAALLFCKYCVGTSITQKSQLPPALARWLDGKKYWDSKVTDDELKDPRGKTPEVHNDRLLTYAEAAQSAGVAATTVRGWVKDGKLKNERIGPKKRDVRIKQSVLLTFLDERMKAGTTSQREKGTERKVRKSRYLALVGEAVKTKRKDKGLQQADVAEATGLSPSTISNIETGARHYVQPDTLTSLRRWLGSEYAHMLEPKPRGTAKPDPQPAPVANGNGHRPPEKTVVLQPVVTDEAYARMAPWEREAAQKAAAEAAEAQEKRLSDLEAAVKRLEDAAAVRDMEVQVFRAWVEKYREGTPDWDGWRELDADLAEVQALEDEVAITLPA